MKRRVLFVPIEEITDHFRINDRQDIKIIVHKILEDEIFHKLKTKKKGLKREQPLQGDFWARSTPEDSNKVCESKEFFLDTTNEHTSFNLAFANKEALQDEHYHTHYYEMYYSESPMTATYRDVNTSASKTITLEHGGLCLFGPKMVHKMQLTGLTLVIEVPSVSDDKIVLDE